MLPIKYLISIIVTKILFICKEDLFVAVIQYMYTHTHTDNIYQINWSLPYSCYAYEKFTMKKLLWGTIQKLFHLGASWLLNILCRKGTDYFIYK